MPVVAEPGDLLTRRLDESGWPLLAPTLLTIHRTSERDERSRQIVYALDGRRLGELLFGDTHTYEILPGPHSLRIHNTLVWQTHRFEAEPGGHVHFTVWNQAWGGYYVMMLFLGAAPLRLGVARGRPGKSTTIEERMTLDEFRQSLTGAEGPPAGTSTLLQALWHDGRGDWERAHEIAQNVESADGARVHAYLHRKEGDSGNAGYWYRRAGQPAFTGTLEQEWDTLVAGLLDALAPASPVPRAQR